MNHPRISLYKFRETRATVCKYFSALYLPIQKSQSNLAVPEIPRSCLEKVDLNCRTRHQHQKGRLSHLGSFLETCPLTKWWAGGRSSRWSQNDKEHDKLWQRKGVGLDHVSLTIGFGPRHVLWNLLYPCELRRWEGLNKSIVKQNLLQVFSFLGNWL